MRMEQNTIILNALDNCIGYIYGCLGEYERIPSWIRSGDTSVNRLVIKGRRLIMRMRQSNVTGKEI